jgi:hypothetical protein
VLESTSAPMARSCPGRRSRPSCTGSESCGARAGATTTARRRQSELRTACGRDRHGQLGRGVAGADDHELLGDAAQGALFKPGQIVLVEIGTPGSGTLEPGYIKSIATDALARSHFAFTGTPGTGAKVYGMYTYGVSQSSVAGLCFEHAKSLGANEQWRVNAATVSISDLKLERGKLPTAKVTFKGATWQQLSALGIPVTTGTDTMAGATSCRDAIILLQLTTDTTRVHYPMESVTFEWNDDLILLPDYNGIEGTTQPFRNPTKQFARAKVRMRTDIARITNWTARDKLMLFVMIPTGTGLTKRWSVFGMPTCVIFGNPKHVMADYSVSEFTLHSKQGALTTGATHDLALTPILMAHG